MPYARRKRLYKRRRVFRRRRFPTRRFSRGVKKTLFRISEGKNAALTINASLNTGGVALNYWTIPAISVGSADNARVGNVIWGRRLTYQLKFSMTASATDVVRDYTLYVVTPRQLSVTDAAVAMNANNFPVYALHDQDSFIIHRKMSWTMTNQDAAGGLYNGSVSDKWFRYSLKLNRKLIYPTASDTFPSKLTYLVITNVAISTVTTSVTTINGYIKLSYKDI